MLVSSYGSPSNPGIRVQELLAATIATKQAHTITIIVIIGTEYRASGGLVSATCR